MTTLTTGRVLLVALAVVALAVAAPAVSAHGDGPAADDARPYNDTADGWTSWMADRMAEHVGFGADHDHAEDHHGGTYDDHHAGVDHAEHHDAYHEGTYDDHHHDGTYDDHHHDGTYDDHHHDGTYDDHHHDDYRGADDDRRPGPGGHGRGC